LPDRSWRARLAGRDVFLNEKKQIVMTMRGYYQVIRSWE